MKTKLKRLLPILPAALMLALAVWLLVAPTFRAAAPTHAQWLDAAAFVQERWQEGDLVRLEPTWLTAGRVYFSDLDGRKREPLSILDIHDPVDHPYLYGFTRLWVVSAVESRSEHETAAPPGATLVEETELPGVTVVLYEIPAGVIRWSLLSALRTVVVQRTDSDQGPVSCRWRGDRIACGMKGHLDVTKELRRVAGGPRECVLVRPGPGESPTRLRIPISGSGLLVVRAGNTVEAARAKDGGDVSIRVSVGDEVFGDMVLKRRSYRLEEFRLVVGQPEKIELVIDLAATDDRKREICLDGYLLDAEVYH